MQDELPKVTQTLPHDLVNFLVRQKPNHGNQAVHTAALSKLDRVAPLFSEPHSSANSTPSQNPSIRGSDPVTIQLPCHCHEEKKT